MRSTLGGAHLHSEVKVVDLDAAFEALDAEFEQAANEWSAIRRKVYEEGTGEVPEWPAAAFRPRFMKLADQGQFDSIMWMAKDDSTGDIPAQMGYLERLLTEYANDERIENMFFVLHWMYPVETPDFQRIVADFAARTEVESFQHGANAALGLALVSSETKPNVAKGLALLKPLVRVKVDFPLSNEVASSIFVGENLQIGMVAPNFEAVDVDGDPISLAEYRGKVTVVDFWGFW